METTPRRVHVGHSTGGGEVIHYVARHGEDRVSTAVPISAVPPLMVETDSNPGGLPKDVFDDLQAQLAANLAQFYYDIHSWRQGMMGSANAHCDRIVAFSQTDFTEDLQRTTMPVLVRHGDDDQIVPYADSGLSSAKLARNGTLKIYEGFPHGTPTPNADTINADLLAFIHG
nr:alpha/beta hydrolase [Burkholderia latens]